MSHSLLSALVAAPRGALPSVRAALLLPRRLSSSSSASTGSASGSGSGHKKHESGVLCEVDGNGIAVITLNNPTKLNALTEELGNEFFSHITALRERKDVRCAILTGAGAAFSAGGDLAFLQARTVDKPLHNAEVMRQFYNRFLVLRTLDVPVIAAINGSAVGAGLCVAMACDLRIVANDAKLGWTFTALGLHPGMAATHFTPLLLGYQQAARMLLTSEVITGAQSVGMGLALEALPQAEVLERARKLALQISSQSPVAVRTLIKSLRMRQDRGLAEALAREADCQSQSYASTDILEGIEAVRNKRRPNFLK